MVHADGPVGLDGVAVALDDERAVAGAGIVLVATLAQRLGIEALVDARVVLGERVGAGNEGAKVMTRGWASSRCPQTSAKPSRPGCVSWTSTARSWR
jgi:hypothetical protein